MDTTISHRLVHLDLKGAPFVVNYWHQLIPFLSRCGVNGLLIEYEDMFPYDQSLSDIKCTDAYSDGQLQSIVRVANVYDMKIVPLIQTFGHLEFVLKHQHFRHLREVPAYPNSLCPANEQSMDTIQEMLRQMIEWHQRWTQIQTIHIGCDEVWQLGRCQRCQQYMNDNCLTDKSALFAMFVAKVSAFVKKTFDIKVIIWDDMIRQSDTQTIVEYKLNSLVEPMVWHYLDTDSFQLRDEKMWIKYKHLFDRIWIATAFKGAIKMNQMLPPIKYHISNHLAWVQVLDDNQLWPKVAGLAMTGWQRFDHMTTLCELLPNSVISLLMCLFAFNDKQFNDDLVTKVSTFVGNKVMLPIDVQSISHLDAIDSDVYPGATLYKLCIEWQFLVNEFKTFKSNQSLEGAFTSYQIRHNRTNPLHIEAFLLKAKVLLFEVRQQKHKLVIEMKTIFYDTTVDEWIETNIDPILNKLDQIVTNADQQLANQ